MFSHTDEPSKAYVLDTCVLVHLCRDDKDGKAIDVQYRLSGRMHSHLISVVTHGEMWTFAEYNNWGSQKRTKFKKLLGEVVTVEVDESLVEAYAEIDLASRRYKPGAIKMGKNDLWIAATAKVYGLTLLTIDTDFDHLDQSLVAHERWMRPTA